MVFGCASSLLKWKKICIPKKIENEWQRIKQKTLYKLWSTMYNRSFELLNKNSPQIHHSFCSILGTYFTIKKIVFEASTKTESLGFSIHVL